MQQRIARADPRSVAPISRPIEGADDLATEYASADWRLCAFGVTAYELAAIRRAGALSVPDRRSRAIGVRLSSRPAWAFRWVCRLRLKTATSPSAVRALLGDSARRRDMRAAGLTTIDGDGAARIAADLSARAVRRAANARRGSDCSRLSVFANTSRPVAGLLRHHAAARRRERFIVAAEARPALS